MTQLDTMDTLAMYLGGGLIILGIPVLGFILTITGAENPAFDPIIRGYLTLIGFLLFAVLGVYKLFTPGPGESAA